jgi:hypothetical protein
MAVTSLVLVLTHIALLRALCLSSAVISFLNLYLGPSEVFATLRRRPRQGEHA